MFENMIALSGGKQIAALDYNTALTLEARRRGVSDGALMAETDEAEREKIALAYLERKNRRKKEQRQQCAGCIYYVKMLSNSNNRICSFHQTERLRRRDKEGNCLEYTKEKHRPAKKVSQGRKGAGFGQREGTATWRLMNEDFSGKTIPEIAEELGKDGDMVRRLMSVIKRETGKAVPYRKRKGISSCGTN